jgi:hypothetical protein
VRNALRRDRHLRDYCGSERIRRRRSSASAVPSSPPIGAPYIRAGQYVPWSATYRFLITDRCWILMSKISHLDSHRLQPFLTTQLMG